MLVERTRRLDALVGCDCDVDVVLRDGEIAHIRSVRESDAGALRTMYDRGNAAN